MVGDMDAEVDITLIAAMLALTPEQRLQQNDRTLVMLQELRDGLARVDQPPRETGRSAR